MSSWGQLVPTYDIHEETIVLSGERFTIGRSRGADLSLPEVKVLSGIHCMIERAANGKVYLLDSSTNGTLVKNERIHKAKCELAHGDELFLVYNKNSPDMNISYLYQDMAQLLAEESLRSDSSQLEQTQVMTSDTSETDDNIEAVRKNPPSPGDSDSQDSPLCSPRKRYKQGESVESEKGNHPSAVNKEAVATSEAAGQPGLAVSTSEAAGQPELAVSTSEAAGQPGLAVSTSKAAGQPGSAVATSEPAAQLGLAKATAGQSGLSLTTAGVSTTTTGEAGVAMTAAGEGSAEMEESLTCVICQEIMHDCVSIQPCLHTFCAGCVFSWLNESIRCPTCRKKAEFLNKNHMLNNVIEVYLKSNPSKKQLEEEIKKLDAKNIMKDSSCMSIKRVRQILKSEMNPNQPAHSQEDSGADSSDDDEADRDDDDYYGDPYDYSADVYSLLPQGPLPWYEDEIPSFRRYDDYDLPSFSFAVRPRPRRGPSNLCRQCPSRTMNRPAAMGNAQCVTGGQQTVTNAIDQPWKEDEPRGAAAAAGVEAAAGCSAVAGADAPGRESQNYVCPLYQVHIMCQCCMEPMPDRRDDRRDNQLIPAQECGMCSRICCKMYFGNCGSDDSAPYNACLAKFRDHRFPDSVMDKLVLDNVYESRILKDILSHKNLSTVQLVHQLCDTYGSASASDHNLNVDMAMCLRCAQNKFKDLAYRYREAIKPGELPGVIPIRPDCHWGKNCRTQRSKLAHAQNFNHICEQTRFP